MLRRDEVRTMQNSKSSELASLCVFAGIAFVLIYVTDHSPMLSFRKIIEAIAAITLLATGKHLKK